jgi:alpha-N-arabinofuranosidase
MGLIGTHWSKGWIIESNTVSHSICSGIALGKHGDQFDNTSANSAEGYVKTIERAHAHPIPWTKENIGYHLVRHNTISHCEQTGIVGSLGCSFSTVTGNVIHDIHVRQLFTGAEMAGIKFHGAIDTTISRNHIYRTTRGIWLDWMAQGARVSGNLLHDNNTAEDLFLEVNHGPCMVDHNLFLSRVNVLDISEGSAFAHNLFAGKMVAHPERGRATPFHPPHSTAVAGLPLTFGGDDRFYNNIFVGNGTDGSDTAKVAPHHAPRGAGYGLWAYDRAYDQRAAPLQTGGNVLFHGAKPYAQETNALVLADRNPGLALIQREGQFLLRADFGAELKQAATVPVTTALLGKAKISNAAYETPDGSPLKLDADYFGKKRDRKNPFPGPFENAISGGPVTVWPVSSRP